MATRASHSQTESDSELLPFLQTLIEARWFVVLATFVLASFSFGLSYLVPERYTAHSVILPWFEEGGQLVPGQVRSLAADLNIPLPGSESPLSGLLAEIVMSRTVIYSVLAKVYQVPGSEPRELLSILDVEGDSRSERLEKGWERFRQEVLTVKEDMDTGIVRVYVKTRHPELSAKVNNDLLEGLGFYLTSERTKDASREKLFIQQRLEEIKLQLEDSEEALKAFRERNVRINDSPALLLEEGRLRRRVRVEEEVFVELQRQYEIAKIEEVRNQPLLRVLDRAVPPVEPSEPQRLLFVFAVACVAFVISVVYVILRSYVRSVYGRATEPLLEPLRRDLAKIWWFRRAGPGE
jgi:uncharacterized protein involved in exopolysaccharide biosynthesis